MIWLAAVVALVAYFAVGLFVDGYLRERGRVHLDSGLAALRVIGWPFWWGVFGLLVGVWTLLEWASDTGHRLGADARDRR